MDKTQKNARLVKNLILLWTVKQYYYYIIIIISLIILGTLWNNYGQKNITNETGKFSSSSIKVNSNSSISKSLSTTNMTPEMIINSEKKYTAIMKTTAGDITLELYSDKTPITVNNFVSLSRKNFYNDVIFHRVIPEFMIQGGDPTGTGTGGPGYKFNDEKFSGEYTRGTLAMANAGPNTNGSQFFIMVKDTPLPKNYVIFGKIISGIEIVDKIVSAPTIQDGRENSRPINPVKINSITVVEE